MSRFAFLEPVLQKAHQISENWNGFISAIWESAISIDYHRAESSIERAVTVCFRQITNIILNSITGKGLKNSSDFTVSMYKNNNTYFAKLYPKKKELKQIYQVIEIYFNANLTMVSSVKLEEKTGDVTWVRLYNPKTSVMLNESLFNTD